MKTKKEIFESVVKNTRFEMLSASSDIGQGIIMGYSQCQQDNSDLKYTIEDMIKASNVKCRGMCEKIVHDHSDNATCCTGMCENFDELIKSLNKK